MHQNLQRGHVGQDEAAVRFKVDDDDAPTPPPVPHPHTPHHLPHAAASRHNAARPSTAFKFIVAVIRLSEEVHSLIKIA